MTLLSFSTSACKLTGGPSALLDCWQSLCQDRAAALATDPRLTLVGLKPLLQEARRRGLLCCESAHALAVSRASRPLPAPISDDQSERAAAGELLLKTLLAASEHEVRRVLLLPAQLPLSSGREELRGLYARGVPLPPADLLDERAARAPAALERLCTVLDRSLVRAEALGLCLALAAPAPWPDQIPDASEAGVLLGRFAGAPLELSYATDWAHICIELGSAGGEGEVDEASGGPSVKSLRLADASGLRASLPLGLGEIDWGKELARLPESARRVLAVGPDVRPGELDASFRLATSWKLSAAGEPPA